MWGRSRNVTEEGWMLIRNHRYGGPHGPPSFLPDFLVAQLVALDHHGFQGHRISVRFHDDQGFVADL